MILTRRKFIQTALTLTSAPAIVRASSLMPVKQYYYPGFDYITIDHVEIYHNGCKVYSSDASIHTEVWIDD